MSRVIFKNQAGVRIQVCVEIAATVSNFQISASELDDNTRADEGEIVTFWWRDDGNPCRRCDDGSDACAQHRFAMPASDTVITLGDGHWSKQTN